MSLHNSSSSSLYDVICVVCGEFIRKSTVDTKDVCTECAEAIEAER